MSVEPVCGSLCGMTGGAEDVDGDTVPATADSLDPSLMRLRDFVARRRIELGLSQRTLAEKAGVSLGTATRLERGSGPPRVSTVPKLEDALQWPRGTFQAIRDGGEPPKLPPRADPDVPPATARRHSSAEIHSATQYGQALGIASAVVSISAICLEILTSDVSDSAARVAAINALDANMRDMESLIAASLPDAESAFDEAIEVMREVHESRESIQKAAQSLS